MEAMEKMKKTAFTLIELLIVVAIIGILAAIAVPNFMNAQLRAKLARTYADLKAVQTSIGMYTADTNWAPPDWGEEITTGKSYVALTTPIAYLSSISSCKDPFATKVDQNAASDGYIYCEYGAALRVRSGKLDIEADRVKNYAEGGTTYIMVSGGPDRDTDWPWTNWGAGLLALRTPDKAGPRGDGGVFYSVSNGLNSSGDIVSTSSKIFQ
jgi:prepilin-type N-terminal cleavage/methylation domain-containing protein